MIAMEEAKYKQIEQDVRDKISNEQLKVGDAIDTEQHLAEQYGVSKLTVNKALSQLAREGLIQRVRGKGSFVSSKKGDTLIAERDNYSLSKNLIRDGMKPSSKLLKYEVIDSDRVPAVAKTMHLKKNIKLHYFSRVHYADGVPIAISENYVSIKALSVLDVTCLDNGSFWTYYLENCLQKPVKRTCNMSAVLSDDKQILEMLNITPNTPLLSENHVSYNSRGEIIIYGEMLYVGDRYTYIFTASSAKE